VERTMQDVGKRPLATADDQFPHSAFRMLN
jgi:hypothetical protein